MELKIDGWDEGGEVPAQFTCDGDNVSPAVSWSGAPREAKSFVLALIDPGAPRGTFTHWLLFNLPAHINALPEWVDGLPAGTQEGTNGFGSLGYGGPCPPAGQEHRYRFELYALDTMLKLSEGVGLRHAMSAMQGHVLAVARVEARYRRSRRLRQPRYDERSAAPSR